MCPLTGDDCMKHGCDWYVNIQGVHPQTEQVIDQWGCSMAYLPLLLVDNTQQQRHTGAAVESFRNEMVKDNQAMLQSGELAKRLNGG